ncbi:MAG: cation transporter [Phenylobacterium sp.]|nr:MAG: cation transporter [Phenylobacterium sp.]
MMADETGLSLRRAIATVAILNLAYFGVELGVALRIGSVSLVADSADFFEDAAVNGLILLALGWRARPRARVGLALSGVLLLPVAAFLWTLWRKLAAPTPPDPGALALTGLGALAINLFCAVLLARYRAHAGSLTRAAFLSARNDAAANLGIIGAGLVTALTRSLWPDVVVGLAIAGMNLDAARQVWAAARGEHAAAEP